MSKDRMTEAVERFRKAMQNADMTGSKLAWDNRAVWEGVRDKSITRLVIKR